MIKTLANLALHLLLRWNARVNAAAQRTMIKHLDADLAAAKRAIPECDRLVEDYESKVRTLQNELRARKTAKLYQ